MISGVVMYMYKMYMYMYTNRVFGTAKETCPVHRGVLISRCPDEKVSIASCWMVIECLANQQ